jgi:hypothetical protein
MAVDNLGTAGHPVASGESVVVVAGLFLSLAFELNKLGLTSHNFGSGEPRSDDNRHDSKEVPRWQLTCQALQPTAEYLRANTRRRIIFEKVR